MNGLQRILRGALALLWITGATAFAAPPPHPSVKDVVCSDCHACSNPTAEKPCLHRCPRPRVTPKALNMGPDHVILDELEYEYEAVIFNHRLHAEMSAMGSECSSCHHFSEGGHIDACKACHPVGAREDIHQPGLKGAYHRQCMGCHRDWSGLTNCEICHAKKAVPGAPAVARPDGPSPAKQLYRQLTAPDKKVWRSTYGGGTVVTLHHKAHVERYGIDCAMCHHAEGCGSCHYEAKSTQHISHSEEALHGICNRCHEEMSCNQCHLKAEAPEFSHDRTGWPLKGYHAQLECKRCHGNPYHFTKPARDCNGCHRGRDWSRFDHARAGLTLDDVHREFECETCHSNGNYKLPPACGECHDKDITYPARLPGSRTGG